MTAPRSARSAALPAELRDQLRHRLAGRAPQPDPITPVAESEPTVATSGQRRLWFLHELQPGSVAYHSALALRLTGALRLPALAAAIQCLVARHESIRTTFDERAGVVIQVVQPPAELPLPVIDLAGRPGSRDGELDRILAREYARPFDLRRGPVLRALLVRAAAGEHALLLTAHHIVTDGTSTAVLLAELAEAYAAAVRGTAAALPPLPVRYRDFAAWERRRSAGPAVAAQVEYWRRQLAGFSPVELPTDRPRPPAPADRGPVGPMSAGAAHRFALPAAVAAGLRALARARRCTMFTVLVAGCQVLIARHAGRADVALGTVVAGRPRPELERVVGFFANTVVIRSTVDGRRSVGEFLAEVAGTVLDAVAHGEAPFDQVVRATGAGGRAGRNPLFDVLLAYQPRQAPPEFPGLRVAEVDVPRGAAIADLLIEFRESAGTVAGSLTYNSDLFDAGTVARMADDLLAVLGRLAADPGGSVAGLLPPAAASHRQPPAPRPPDAPDRPGQDVPGGPDELVGLPAGPPARAADRLAAATLPGLVARQVGAHPDRPAIRAGGQTVTYRELDARAARLADRLAAAGLRRGDRACAAVESGVDAVTAFLALARIGASYACLVPGMPPERVRGILADCRPRLVLAGAGGPTFDPGGLAVLPIEGGAEPRPAAPPPAGPGPADPLCTVYTSGSTGRPKGVVLTQHNVVNLVRWHAQVLGGAPGDRVGQLASLSFDASVWEIWSALCLGTCLCVADPALRADPRELAGWIVHEGLVRCFLPTAVATRMFASAALAGASRLRQLLVGGEKLAAAPPELPFAVLNVYGPTESAVLATWFDLTGWRPAGPAGGPPPIGRPLSNLRTYLLDGQLRPVPAGQVAELYLAGDGVAAGYLGQPGLTAERFLADRYGPPGARMYRTGDLASATADGLLEFHGRVDRQLKIHGVRVELDEIAHQLARHEQVAEAAVVAVPGGSATPVIVAYLTGATGRPVDLAEVRGWLRRRLPAAMLPARIGQLPALPHTLGGKTDLRALAGRPLPPAWPPPARMQPGTDTERAVARCWADVLGDVLGGEPVGVRENFFDVGGSSMTLLELRGRLEPRYGGTLPIALLFEHTTIAEQARLLDERAGRHSATEGDCQL